MRFARGARRWTAVAALLVVPAVVLLGATGLAALALPVLVALFFRDPERTPEGDGVLAPADGRITVLGRDDDRDGRVRLGIFMNLTDVHVNRAPVAGHVASREHRSGGHRPAFTKDSERNERVVWRFAALGGDGADGVAGSDDDSFEVVQIAGTVARRITPYVEEGATVDRGGRIGVIAFGSRVDVVFPPGYGVEDLVVERGDRVRAGETVVAPEP